MSKLILKRFHCVVETNEIGADSPYFLTFVGDITGQQPPHIKMTRQGNWENEVDQGEIWTVNETVADGFNFLDSKKTVVICGMVEEDEGLDITSAELNNVKNLVQSKLDVLKATGSNTVTGFVRSELAKSMRVGIVAALLTNSGAKDDIVNCAGLALNNATGEQALVKLYGDGGKYHLRYGVA